MGSMRKNFLFTLASQLLVVMTPLVVMPFVARRLLVANVGISSFTESITYFFSLFAVFGCFIYGQREIAYCKGDERARLTRFLEIFASVSVTSLLTLAAFLVFICFQSQYQVLYLIQILELIAYWWDVSWYYQGCEDFKQLLVRNIFVKGSTILLIFLLIRDTNDLPLYVFLRCATLFAGSAILLAPILRKAWRLRVVPAWETIPKHLRGMFFLFLPSIAVTVYTVLDKTMIGVITSAPEQNGFYEEATKIVRVLLNVVGTVSIVLLPRIAALYAEGNRAAIMDKLHKSFALVYFITFPMICGMMFIIEPFVPWFFGAGFEGVIDLVYPLSLLLLLIGLGRILGTTLVSIGEEVAYTRNLIIGAVVNFVLNLLLIPRYQALGAAWASVAAEAIITTLMLCSNRQLVLFRKILCAMIVYGLATGGMAVALWQVRLHFTGSTLLLLGTLVVVGMSVYAGILLLLREAFLIETMKHLWAKVHRRSA